METIQINVPEDIKQQIGETIDDQQHFILEAIQEKLDRKQKLDEELREGYQATFEEDLNLTSDFESTDLESWK